MAGRVAEAWRTGDFAMRSGNCTCTATILDLGAEHRHDCPQLPAPQVIIYENPHTPRFRLVPDADYERLLRAEMESVDDWPGQDCEGMGV
jgi:hypothetical protein